MDAKLAQKVAERTLQENQSSSADPNITAGDAKVGEGRSQDVTDLILVVHGIGQGVRYFILYDALLIRPSAFSTIRGLQFCIHGQPHADRCSVNTRYKSTTLINFLQKAGNVAGIELNNAFQ